jgi:hypothetical protein
MSRWLAAIDSAVARRRDDRGAWPLVWWAGAGVSASDSVSASAGGSPIAVAAVLLLRVCLGFLAIRQPSEWKMEEIRAIEKARNPIAPAAGKLPNILSDL